MTYAIIIVLFILLILGIISIPGIILNAIILAHVNNHAISVWDILVFLVILWAIDALFSPLREIAAILLIIWVLSVLGIVTLTGFGNILIISVILGLIVSVLKR